MASQPPSPPPAWSWDGYRRRVLQRIGPQLAADAEARSGQSASDQDARPTRRPDGRDRTAKTSKSRTPSARARATTGDTSDPGQPTTDTEFLDYCSQLTRQLSCLAAEVAGWAEGLTGLHLPESVLTPLNTAAGLLAGAAVSATQAREAFKEQFGSARQASERGLRITGESS